MRLVRTCLLLGFCVSMISGCSSGNISGGGTVSGTPITVAGASLSSTALVFAPTSVGMVTAVQTVTLTNSGAATLTITSITPSDKVNFAMTTTCGTTLAANASCSIAAAFQPQSASTFAGSIAVADSAAGSPQSIALSGTGTAAGSTKVTRTFLVFPDQGFTAIYALVTGATKTIDMTMYELVDTTFSGDLVAACQRGVKVRVILDQNLEKSSNTPAYNAAERGDELQRGMGEPGVSGDAPEEPDRGRDAGRDPEREPDEPVLLDDAGLRVD